jgi:hypothetical protein
MCLFIALKGYSFKAFNALDQVKTTKYIFKFLDEGVQEVGEANVVQVVTDNSSNCVSA